MHRNEMGRDETDREEVLTVLLKKKMEPKEKMVAKQRRHRWPDRRGQECHLRVPGVMTQNKAASTTALFLTFTSPRSNSLHVHLLAFRVHELLKTIRAALSAYTFHIQCNFSSGSSIINCHSFGKWGRFSSAVTSMVTVSAPHGCTEAVLGLLCSQC